jgi:hypothetical protein
MLCLCLPLWAQEGEADLNLTPKQQRGLRVLRDRFDGKRQDLRVRLESKRVELAELLRQDNTEKTVLQAKLDEILALEGERQRLMLDEIFEAKGQLSGQQWSRFRRRVLSHLLERPSGQRLPRRGSGRTSP